MSIQWFPGHMHLTRKAIGERVKTIDVVIEMVDARLPASSANPMLRELLQHKPNLKVLNKADLADPERTQQWLQWYGQQQQTRAVAMDSHHSAPARALIEACQALAPGRGSMDKPMRVLICGIPNVGKSTLINTMVGKRAAKAANEPGVTRREQRFALQDGFYLFDTPGVLWPRIIVAQSGYNLAAAGSIGRNAFDDELVALELLAYLQRHYAALLLARYAVAPSADALAQLPDHALFEAIGRQRGALLPGGRINAQKTAEIILQDFRSGAIGRVTIETPAEFEAWQATGERLDAERQLRKEQAEQQRQQSKRRRR
ncbi:ribosome biogenesis GTPase YlqF [Vandammella animalimorsus]|uniref:Ribosome biogenesis GTPase A n=1 Tax=Vandammella animalimorsus TaxID=2029117 RepID=A0A2A2AWM6_9BURK|nr:ribosome biogenesis GTPase YlqF [Vandammella animalimorsus]PAT42141.1 ribosome biogenesis GTPase YlqF [Vandammella animalimorsus]PAX16632.1 ribosome biogenesis GTPase YlqF [Vandammella animalimorsus]PAX19262.1 ribosome biogenesis GTPase YlqF [Vandammella animalimorsus]